MVHSGNAVFVLTYQHFNLCECLSRVKYVSSLMNSLNYGRTIVGGPMERGFGSPPLNSLYMMSHSPGNSLFSVVSLNTFNLLSPQNLSVEMP